MSNFDPHELKPDSSDRPNTNRTKKTGPSFVDTIKARLANLNISRQHLMIAIGILVLLIIILTIVSALKGSESTPTQPQAQNIVLPSQNNTTENNNDPFANLPAPSTSSAPEQSTMTPPPVQPTQPPEITMSQSNTSQPNIAPNTTAPSTHAPQQQATNTSTPVKPATPKAQTAVPVKQASIASLPSSYVTLQLSSASQPKTLEAFAKKQNLEQYWIYETRRDSKPWFVLIYGSYPNVQQANQAISTLPADVQSKKPWVKPIRQVQQEAKQR